MAVTALASTRRTSQAAITGIFQAAEMQAAAGATLTKTGNSRIRIRAACSNVMNRSGRSARPGRCGLTGSFNVQCNYEAVSTFGVALLQVPDAAGRLPVLKAAI